MGLAAGAAWEYVTQFHLQHLSAGRTDFSHLSSLHTPAPGSTTHVTDSQASDTCPPYTAHPWLSHTCSTQDAGI